MLLSRMFARDLSDDQREFLFDQLDYSYVERFGWAIPDERALNILSHYGPIVEVGAGLGYWGRLLINRGIDYLGYDINASNDKKKKKKGGKGKGKKNKQLTHDEQTEEDEEGSEKRFPSWCRINRGTSEVLKGKKMKKRSLFLCYPDDFELSSESLALSCLEAYKGDTIILVGELFGSTVLENPWGKSAGPDFQINLMASFHKVLQVPLPSWMTSRDSLSVWKRTQVTSVDEGEFTFKDIPVEQRLVTTIQYCPETQHLVV